MQQLYTFLILLILPLSGLAQFQNNEIIIVEEKGVESVETVPEKAATTELPVELWDLEKCDRALSDLNMKLSAIADKEDPRYKKYLERIALISGRRKQLTEAKR